MADSDNDQSNDISIARNFNDWEKILSSCSYPIHTHDQITQPHNVQCEMVVTRERNHLLDEEDDDDDCYIFPPSNHENLHIPLDYHHPQQQQHQSSVTDIVDHQEDPSSLLLPSDPLDSFSLFDSQIRVAEDVWKKKLNSGFEFLWSKFIQIGSWFRSYFASASRGGSVESFTPNSTGVTVVIFVSFLCLRWHRRRRRHFLLSQQRKKERLIFLLEQTDEKLSRLLNQVSQINEALSARRGIPVLRTI